MLSGVTWVLYLIERYHVLLLKFRKSALINNPCFIKMMYYFFTFSRFVDV